MRIALMELLTGEIDFDERFEAACQWYDDYEDEYKHKI